MRQCSFVIIVCTHFFKEGLVFILIILKLIFIIKINLIKQFFDIIHASAIMAINVKNCGIVALFFLLFLLKGTVNDLFMGIVIGVGTFYLFMQITQYGARQTFFSPQNNIVRVGKNKHILLILSHLLITNMYRIFATILKLGMLMKLGKSTSRCHLTSS